MRNISRQPKASMSHVSTGGASAGASPDDELKMAIGNARWSSANQSVQTRVPPIYIGDSPRPNATRATMN